MFVGARTYVSLDSYFNALSIIKYKHYTTIADLTMLVQVSGRGVARLCHTSANRVNFILSEKNFSGINQVIKFPVTQWQELQDGLLFLEIVALDDCKVHDCHFVTNTVSDRQIKLSLSITHFNRKAYVVPAMKRIMKFVKSEKKRNMELVVVDNSQNIEAEEHFGATVLPNRNLGGSGGFARALLHSLADPETTHQLFMDDDASCHTEAICRTYDLLKYAKNDDLAVVGAMLLEPAPHIQHEAGAVFDEYCIPLNSGIDVGEVENIIRSEEPQRIQYGAWWYFAFPLAGAGMPYPFFVRGDDVDFGMRNKFRSITVNGIASMQPTFSGKDGPTTRYLDTRHQLAQYFNGNAKLERKKIWRICIRAFWHAALTYRYETAEAGLRALSDILKGPSVFENEPDAATVRADIKAFTKIEVHDMVDASAMVLEHRGQRPTLIRRALRNVTLCAHLLPDFVMRAPVLVQTSYDNSAMVFGYRKVLYSLSSGTGYIATIENRRGLRIIARGLLLSAKVVLQAESLKSVYTKRYPYLISPEFWRLALGMKN